MHRALPSWSKARKLSREKLMRLVMLCYDSFIFTILIYLHPSFSSLYFPRKHQLSLVVVNVLLRIQGASLVAWIRKLAGINIFSLAREIWSKLIIPIESVITLQGVRGSCRHFSLKALRYLSLHVEAHRWKLLRVFCDCAFPDWRDPQ